MRVYVKGPNNIIAIGRNAFVTDDGTQFTAQVHDLSAQELAALNIFDAVDDQPTPENKVVASETFEWTGTGVIRHVTFADSPVPQSVTRYQFKKALLDSNKATDAQNAIAGASAARKLAWSDQSVIRRDGDLVSFLKGALSLTDAQIDAFFRSASKIET